MDTETDVGYYHGESALMAATERLGRIEGEHPELRENLEYVHEQLGEVLKSLKALAKRVDERRGW